MHVAIVGCGHGEIDKIYEVIANIEEKRGIKVGLVLCCGDFESVRNMTDLRCMACPIKFQGMHDFHRYYSGEKKAPILTLFIGGNHEASNFLQELPYGGWVAPNIYYMGYVGIIRFAHLRIAGISGIYKGHDYLKGRFECPPYTDDSMRSVYHYRNLDIFRLKQIKTHVDIVLSHDWPNGIYNFGNFDQLLRRKPFFREEIERGELGSRPLFELLTSLQPTYWFSAHLHVKFGAVVTHEQRAEESKVLSDNPVDENVTAKPPLKTTKFLALDKVLPRRQFLQIVEMPGEIEDASNLELTYDTEWLAVLRSTNHLISTKQNKCFMPGPGCVSRFEFSPTEEELKEVENIFSEGFTVPQNFAQTAPIYIPGQKPDTAFRIENLQTKDFCNKLDINDPISDIVTSELTISGFHDGRDVAFEYSKLTSDSSLNTTYESSMSQISLNPDEISLDDDGSEEESVRATDPLCDRKNLSSVAVNPTSTRKKLVLPPPKSSEDDSNFHKKSGQSSLVDSIFNQSICGPDEPQSLNETGHFFMIDKVGEPEIKKRRNAAFFGSNQ